MIDSMRKPFLFLALVLIALAVLMELGETLLLQVPPPPRTAPANLAGLTPEEQQELQKNLSDATTPHDTPPGLAIHTMAYVDGLFLLTVVLLALPIVVGDRIHGRTQGLIGLIAGFLVLVATLMKIPVLLIELTVRLTLFLAVPFGTIAYMALYGSFDRGGAAVILSLILFLKLGAGACLLLAQQRFVRQYGLLVMYATSIIASILIAFLHGIVPSFLVSITDAIGAIVVDILALIWALVFVIFGIIAVVKAIRLGTRQQAAPAA
ncbi:MAG: hypothetical protein WBX15_03970 [Thermoanaerobaculia bacterium]